MNAKIKDLLDRVGNTVLQAAVGAGAGYFELAGAHHHFDWKTGATVAGVAGATALLKVLGVNASVSTVQRAVPVAVEQAHVVVDDVKSHRWADAEQAVSRDVSEVESFFHRPSPPANPFQAPVEPVTASSSADEAAHALASLAQK